MRVHAFVGRVRAFVGRVCVGVCAYVFTTVCTVCVRTYLACGAYASVCNYACMYTRVCKRVCVYTCGGGECVRAVYTYIYNILRTLHRIIYVP